MILSALVLLGCIRATTGFSLQIWGGSGAVLQPLFYEETNQYNMPSGAVVTQVNGFSQINGFEFQWHTEHINANVESVWTSAVEDFFGILQAWSPPIVEQEQAVCQLDALQYCAEQMQDRDIMGVMICLRDVAEVVGQVSQECASMIDGCPMYQCIEDADQFCPDLDNADGQLDTMGIATCLVPLASQLSVSCAPYLETLKAYVGDATTSVEPAVTTSATPPLPPNRAAPPTLPTELADQHQRAPSQQASLPSLLTQTSLGQTLLIAGAVGCLLGLFGAVSCCCVRSRQRQEKVEIMRFVAQDQTTTSDDKTSSHNEGWTEVPEYDVTV